MSGGPSSSPSAGMSCSTHGASQEGPTLSTLATFRVEIASHLSRVLQRPVEDLLPLVQNETKARAGGGGKGHSLFTVPVQRLFISPRRNASKGKQKEGSGGGIDHRNEKNKDSSSDKSFDDRESLLEQLLVLPEDTKLLAKVSLGANKSLLMFEPDRMELIRRTCLAISRNLDLPKVLGQKHPESETVLGKRCRAKDSLVIVNALPLLETEDPYSSLRRAAIGGFISRFMNMQAKRAADGAEGEVERVGIASGNSVTILDVEASLDEYNGLLGLGQDQEVNPIQGGEGNIVGSDWAFEKMKQALQSNPAVQAVRSEDGFSFVDLTAKGLGQAKVFSTDPSTMEYESSTLITRTVVQLAHHLKDHKESCARYIWIVPENRKRFADQVLCLVGIIFNDTSDEIHSSGSIAIDSIESDGREKTGRQRSGTGSWTNLVEVVLYDPSSGPELWSGATPLENRSISGLVNYATVRMKDVVSEYRGDPQGMDGDDMNDDDYGEKPVLDEASLSRMATILSTSALVVASVGTRLRKKIQLDLTKILDGKGNSGVFLQYVHSRLCGIERNSQVRFNPQADLLLLQKIPEAYALAKVLSEWEDLVFSPSSAVSTTLDPSPLVLYLFNLAAEVGQANRTMRVKGMKPEVAEARWRLFWCAKQVLEAGLWLLGLESVGMM